MECPDAGLCNEQGSSFPLTAGFGKQERGLVAKRRGDGRDRAAEEEPLGDIEALFKGSSVSLHDKAEVGQPYGG